MFTLLTMLAAASMAHADIRPLLRHQGFDHPLNGRETITYAGHVRQGRNDYEIYAYHDVFRAAAVDHGISSLIIVLNGTIYVGHYNMSDPEKCRVHGQKVYCNTDYPGHVIQFTKRGPPYEIWIDGDVDQMSFGNRMKASRCNAHGCSFLEKWARAPWWK